MSVSLSANISFGSLENTDTQNQGFFSNHKCILLATCPIWVPIGIATSPLILLGMAIRGLYHCLCGKATKENPEIASSVTKGSARVFPLNTISKDQIAKAKTAISNIREGINYHKYIETKEIIHSFPPETSENALAFATELDQLARLYTGNAYSIVNQKMRGQGISQFKENVFGKFKNEQYVSCFVYKLQSAILKSPDSNDKTLTRIAYIDEDALKRLSPGSSLLVNRPFLSTSSRPGCIFDPRQSMRVNIVDDSALFDNKVGVTYTIHTLDDTPCYDTAAHKTGCGGDSESEIILPAGRLFRVQEVKNNPGEQVAITLQEVDPDSEGAITQIPRFDIL